MEESKDEIVEWLKRHTLGDMKSLILEMADEGQDVSELVEVINDFEEISRAEGVLVEQEA